MWGRYNLTRNIWELPCNFSSVILSPTPTAETGDIQKKPHPQKFIYGHPFVPWSRLSRFIGDGRPPTFNRNPYNWNIKPYYWVDDHPLLYGKNGSLEPSTFVFFTSPKNSGLRCSFKKVACRTPVFPGNPPFANYERNPLIPCWQRFRSAFQRCVETTLDVRCFFCFSTLSPKALGFRIFRGGGFVDLQNSSDPTNRMGMSSFFCLINQPPPPLTNPLQN